MYLELNDCWFLFFYTLRTFEKLISREFINNNFIKLNIYRKQLLLGVNSICKLQTVLKNEY